MTFRFAIMTVLLLSSIIPSAYAQDKITTFTYSIAFPEGNTRSFIDQTSFRGFGIDGRWLRELNSPLAFGLSFTWQVFAKQTGETIALDSGAVTGFQNRYINSLPILATAYWYTGKINEVRAYFGGGAGVYYIVERLEIGVHSFEEDAWHFGVAPEIGTQFPMGEIEGIFSIRYHYAFSAGNSVQGGDGNDFQYWNFSIGLAWARW